MTFFTGPFSGLAALLVFVNPAGAFLAAYDGSFRGALNAAISAWHFPLLLVLPVIASVCIIRQATARLHDRPMRLRQLTPRVEILQPFWLWLGEEIRIERLRLRHDAKPQARVANPLWQRVRHWRIYNQRGSLGFMQWVGWPIGYLFFVLWMVLSKLTWGRYSAAVFLGCTWAVLGITTAILAASCMVRERRRGFLDLMLLTLLTPKEIIDGETLTIWQHLRGPFFVPLAFGVVFTLTGYPDVFEFLYSTIPALLFCGLLLYQGLACSLTAKNLPGAVVPTVALPLAVMVGLPFLADYPWDNFERTFGVFVIVAAIVSACWARWRTTPATIGCHFLAMHLVFVALATYWAWPESSTYAYASRVQSMNPARLVFDPVHHTPRYWIENGLSPGFMSLSYSLALFFNIVWARSWIIRHFDRLVGRVEMRNENDSSSLAAIPIDPDAGT
jgi:hypothetical protein